MIIETLESGEIITFKLITGEEIIAKLVEFENNILKVSKPLIMFGTQEGLAFVNYLIGSDDENVSFYKESLMNVPKYTKRELADVYIEKTSCIQICRG